MIINAQTADTNWLYCANASCKINDPFKINEATVNWSGACSSGLAEGKGEAKLYYDSVLISTFSGSYKKGKREGEGKLFYSKTNRAWEGTFSEGQMTGKGKYTDDEGNVYDGNFVNYQRFGYGIQKMGNGSRFEGLFNQSRKWTGVLYKYDGTTVYYYRGEEVKNKPNVQSDYQPILGEQQTEYFDKDWNRCLPKQAEFYRLITYQAPHIPQGKIRDYYISGKQISEFYAKYIDYTDDQMIFYVGHKKIFYSNGEVYMDIDYSDKNWKSGYEYTYYENGAIKTEIFYSNGLRNGSYKLWSETGRLKYYTIYEEDEMAGGKYIEYDELEVASFVHKESFSHNKKAWVYNDDNSKSIVNENNHLELTVEKSESSYRFANMSVNDEWSYSIEGSFYKKSSKGKSTCGLIYGMKDVNNYSCFFISNDGKYSISYYVEGIVNTISDGRYSSYIDRVNLKNKLKVARFKDKMYFFINGEKITEYDAYAFRGSGCGFFASGKGVYVLQEITTKELLPPADQGKVDDTPENTKSSSEWKGNGSGFFINEAGLIATNYHVIEDAQQIQVVYFQKGKKYELKAKVELSDKENDLAIVKIDDPSFVKLPSIPYVFTVSPKDVGTEVFALGYPIMDVMGSEVKFTDGKISAQSGFKGDTRLYQISVPIQPGNSGGPLFDIKGNLIGITSSGLNREVFGSENVNYAIKSSFLKKLILQLNKSFEFPENVSIYSQSLTEKIKTLTDFVPLILVK